MRSHGNRGTGAPAPPHPPTPHTHTPHCSASGAVSFRLSDMVAPRRQLSRAGRDECQHCGGYCDWDDESEWEDK